MEILKVENLTKTYGSGENLVNAVDDVSFSVEKGEFVAIVGASGSGKSTLLHLIGGVDRPTSGKIFVDGNDISKMNDDKLAVFRRRQVGIVYQFYNLIPILTVEENITLPCDLDGRGVATATAAALLGLECEIYMGKEDTIRQALNVYRMELLGAKVHAVESGTMTLKDAVNECMREWTSRVDDTLYVLGSVMGPHPFPMIVRDFQSVISREARAQILEKEGRLPDVVMACVGGGSNAMGMFYEFIKDEGVQLIGCEAAGLGVDTDRTAATMATGTEGVFHGMKSYFCQDEYGQIAPVYSISAGLDYPGVGPEHAYLKDIGRAQYVPVTDEEAVQAFEYIAREEGIIAAIESSHAVAHVMKLAPTMRKDQIIICCLSGRGDKDVAAIARYRGVDLHD